VIADHPPQGVSRFALSPWTDARVHSASANCAVRMFGEVSRAADERLALSRSEGAAKANPAHPSPACLTLPLGVMPVCTLHCISLHGYLQAALHFKQAVNIEHIQRTKSDYEAFCAKCKFRPESNRKNKRLDESRHRRGLTPLHNPTIDQPGLNGFRRHWSSRITGHLTGDMQIFLLISLFD
jgi:hypothetical protein